MIRGEIRSPTLSFQLREGFQVVKVVPGYLTSNLDSQGYAALIEGLNPTIARELDVAGRDPCFLASPRAPDAPFGT